MLKYSGFSHQLHDPLNIFSLIFKALKNARIINSQIDPNIRFASRTDRGVGALSQIIALDTHHTPILPEINAYLPDSIRALGLQEVPLTFNPRKEALLRTYSYFLSPSNDFDFQKAQKTLKLLIGLHDFQNFAKNDPKKKINTVKELKYSEIIILGNNTYQIRFSSKSFLWQMIRRIVGHLVDVSTGKYDQEYTSELLEKTAVNLKPTPVSPEYLILEDIIYHDLTIDYEEKSFCAFQQIISDHLLKAKTNMFLYSYLTSLLDE